MQQNSLTHKHPVIEDIFREKFAELSASGQRGGHAVMPM